MKLNIKPSDPTILEDDLCNPIFKFIGDHPTDVYRLMRYIEGLENKIDYLNNFIEMTNEQD